jgi:hypothetical protein
VREELRLLWKSVSNSAKVNNDLVLKSQTSGLGAGLGDWSPTGLWSYMTKNKLFMRYEQPCGFMMCGYNLLLGVYILMRFEIPQDDMFANYDPSNVSLTFSLQKCKIYIRITCHICHR